MMAGKNELPEDEDEEDKECKEDSHIVQSPQHDH